MDALSPKKLCRKQSLIDCRLSQNELVRFNELGRSEGEAQVHLQFGKDDTGLKSVVGYVTAQRSLECPRCLQWVSKNIRADIDLRIVESDERAGELLSSVDPLVLDAEEISLSELIEDDLILSVPLRMCPEPDNCGRMEQIEEIQAQLKSAEDEPDQHETKPNPFAVLAQLKESTEQK